MFTEDFEKLCDQLHRKFRATAAMKAGLLREPHAAATYEKVGLECTQQFLYLHSFLTTSVVNGLISWPSGIGL